RWWQVDGQIRHLVDAQELYEKGWRLGTTWTGPGIPDQGYTGINVAFVLDLLAQQVPEDADVGSQRREQAQRIRREIVVRLGSLTPHEQANWWILVTLAEACFGQRDYLGARVWLQKAAAISPPQRW